MVPCISKSCAQMYILKFSFPVTFVPYLVCIALSQTRSANASDLWNENKSLSRAALQ